MTGTGFLGVPEHTAEAQRLFDKDVDEVGYVMNVSRLWAYAPASLTGLFDLITHTVQAQDFTIRQRGILVAACASAFGDSYCSLAWGRKLAAASDAPTAAGVLRGDDEELTGSERALAQWARKVARDPNRTSGADVQELRDAGYTDHQIFRITVFVALRITLSTVNDALGVSPDAQLRTAAPNAVLQAVTYGRPIAEAGEVSGN